MVTVLGGKSSTVFLVHYKQLFMYSSYDENSICWSIKICVLFPFPCRQSIISCICSSTSKPLSYSTVQVIGIDDSCASQTFPAHVLLKQEASRGVMLQVGLSTSSLDSLCRAGKEARLPAQASLVSICYFSICSPCQVAAWLTSRIFIPTYMTCTAHAAELGPLSHTVQHVQAVREQGQ